LEILTAASIRIEVQRRNCQKNKQAIRSFRCRACGFTRVSITDSTTRGILRFARSLLHNVDCSQVFAGWIVFGGGGLLFFSFPEIHCCCSWSTVSFIENLIVPTVSAHFVTAVYVLYFSASLLFPLGIRGVVSLLVRMVAICMFGHDQRWRHFPTRSSVPQVSLAVETGV
jgi:hypothetical protein